MILTPPLRRPILDPQNDQNRGTLGQDSMDLTPPQDGSRKHITPEILLEQSFLGSPVKKSAQNFNILGGKMLIRKGSISGRLHVHFWGTQFWELLKKEVLSKNGLEESGRQQ
jgi:hypothetical protein